MVFPKKDTLLAHHHAQTALSFSVHHVLLSAKNQLENMVFDVIYVPLPVLCVPSVFNMKRVNLVRFCTKIG